jgi:hypothetical protein
MLATHPYPGWVPLIPMRLGALLLLAGVLPAAGAPLLGIQPGLASAVSIVLAVVVVAVVAACAATAAPQQVPVTSAMLRRRNPGARPLRQRDPDAAGRARPRAPSEA